MKEDSSKLRTTLEMGRISIGNVERQESGDGGEVDRCYARAKSVILGNNMWKCQPSKSSEDPNPSEDNNTVSYSIEKQNDDRKETEKSSNTNNEFRGFGKLVLKSSDSKGKEP